MKKYILLLLVAVAVFTGCETKIDLNADYKQIPVIYGLLEGNKDVQLIKINRSFLGETNALVAAQVPDSTFYVNITPVLEKLNGGNVIDTRTLRDTVLADRQPGDFYVSPNKYYFFNSADEFLDKGFEYRLKFEANGQIVFAETVLLESFEPKSPLNFTPVLSIVRNDAVAQGKVEYQSISMKVSTKENVRLYQTNLKVRYKVVYRNGSVSDKEVLVPLEDILTTRLTGGESLETVITGESIFGAIGAEAAIDSENESDVKYRELGTIELKSTSATDDLNTYLESISPASGVVLEKPQYTNINFGEDELGIGIFTSRSSFIKDYDWDTKTMKAFSVEVNTKDYKFCTFDPVLQGTQRVDCRTFN
tara:strand:- start:10088 stop:11179 length:1092 start_codon:yes stop_codon:yes gene_type:complete